MVEQQVAAKMPARSRRKDDISEKDEFHLPQIPEEEIQKFMIEEDLTECERIKLLLNKREVSQFSYVFMNAVNIFKDDVQMQSEILPILVDKIRNYTEDQQIMAGDAFSELIELKILDKKFAEMVFTLAEEMLNQWSRQILESWIGVFANLLPVLAQIDNSARKQDFVQKGVKVVKRMSQQTETLAVRTSSALLIGAIADANSLLSPQTFEQSFLPIVTNICQDFNWEVRKEICGQLPFIGKYLSAQKAYQHLYPELQELLDDEEREVVTTAIESFKEMVEQFLSTDPNVNNITDTDSVRQQLNNQLKKMLKQESFIGKVDVSRDLLVNVFWIATLIDLPQDEELQQALLNLLKAWRPGPGNRFAADDYERQYMALALANLAKLYQHKTLQLFYTPLYQDFVVLELSADKSQEGSKIQFAQVFPALMEHCLKAADPNHSQHPQTEESKESGGAIGVSLLHKQVIDSYKSFFDIDQNKEVLHMALDHCTNIIVKMQEPALHNLDQGACAYFDNTFKAHFKLLEKQIHSNWRLHKAYFEAQGQLCLTTSDQTEQREIVQMMLNTIKGKTCSLPVKKAGCEKLAQMIATKSNYVVRQLIHKTMMTGLAVSRSSQQRQTFLLFMEQLLPLISSVHFTQVYAEIFLEFREEPVAQVLVQWVKLFPVTRLRITDQRLSDRLDMLLRNLQSKYSKVPKSQLILATLEEMQQHLRTPAFQQKCQEFMANQNAQIMQREVEIDRVEQEEQKSARATGSSSNMKKLKVPAVNSMSSLLTVPTSGTGKRPGSQRLSGTSPNPGGVGGSRRTTRGAADASRNAKNAGMKTNVAMGSANRIGASRSTLEEHKNLGGSQSGLRTANKVPKAKKL